MSESSRVSPTLTKPIIGIVGGIGAGKTLVAQILESLGAAVINSDRLAHEEFRDAEIVSVLRGWWGDRVCPEQGEIDRTAVAAIVFDDPAELARLEALLYPRLARRRRELMVSHDADPKVLAIVLDAPKLFEVGLHEACDSVIFVDAERRQRLTRLAATRRWTEEDLEKREKLLEPLDIKRAIADYVVVNHSSIRELRSEIERVFASTLASFD